MRRSGRVGLALLALALLGADADPEALVRRLLGGEADAAGALLDLDRSAVPALRAALADPDSGQARPSVAAVLESIERRRLYRPTMVELSVRDRPLGEAVEALSRAGGPPVALVPADDPAWPLRRVTVEAGGPVPFWEAVDRLCEAGKVALDRGVRSGPYPADRPGERSARLVAGPGRPVPTSRAGPYRVDLLDLAVTRTAAPTLDGAGRRDEQFEAALLVIPEPGLGLEVGGLPSVDEAVDDLGNDLRSMAPTRGGEGPSWLSPLMPGRDGSLPFALPLAWPSEPGRKLARLRGSIPVRAIGRVGPPTVVPLDEAEGRTFAALGTTVAIRSAEAQADGSQAVIELTVRGGPPPDPASWMGGAPPPPGPNQAAFGPHRPAYRPDDHFVVVDARGRALRSNSERGTQPGPDGTIEVRVRVHATPEHPPAALLYYGLVGARLEIPFAFTDVPLP